MENTVKQFLTSTYLSWQTVEKMEYLVYRHLATGCVMLVIQFYMTGRTQFLRGFNHLKTSRVQRMQNVKGTH